MSDKSKTPITDKVLDTTTGLVKEGIELAKTAAFLMDAKGYASAVQALIALAKLEQAVHGNSSGSTEEAESDAGEDPPTPVDGRPDVVSFARELRA